MGFCPEPLAISNKYGVEGHRPPADGKTSRTTTEQQDPRDAFTEVGKVQNVAIIKDEFWDEARGRWGGSRAPMRDRPYQKIVPFKAGVVFA